jgi:hypothetical protein
VKEAASRGSLAWRTLLKPLVHLLTAYNSLYESIASIAIPSMRRLAGAHDYRFEAVRRDDCLRNVGWIKIGPIRDALAGNTDYVLWLDIDALPAAPMPISAPSQIRMPICTCPGTGPLPGSSGPVLPLRDALPNTFLRSRRARRYRRTCRGSN